MTWPWPGIDPPVWRCYVGEKYTNAAIQNLLDHGFTTWELPNSIRAPITVPVDALGVEVVMIAGKPVLVGYPKPVGVPPPRREEEPALEPSETLPPEEPAPTPQPVTPKPAPASPAEAAVDFTISGCFIVTAVGEAKEVAAARKFRDRYLGKYSWLMKFYYSWSPKVAEQLRVSPRLRRTVRWMINLVLRLLVS